MGKRTSISLIQKEVLFEKLTFQTWFLFQTLLQIPLKLWLFYRVLKKKEEKSRLSERWGKSQRTREVFKEPHRPLLWFHAASVGETASILDLATHLAKKENYNILLTTATKSAKELVSKHLLRNHGIALFHQYAPLDVPAWVHHFLKNWRPRGAVFIESEIWPVRLKICQNNCIPTMLIGARLSTSSMKYWQKFPFLLKIILNCFSWVSPKDAENAQRFQYFNQNIRYLFPCDLKSIKAPLPFDHAKSKVLKERFQNKKIFLAVSTHPKEEVFFARAKKQIKSHENWLFIFAPRHVERAKNLSNILEKAPLFSHGKIPELSDSFWIIDTIGDLGLFFSIADCCFIGGSLLPNSKGHNPYEALQFNLKTSVGCFYSNWIETYSELKERLTRISTISDFLYWIENDTSVLKLEITDSHIYKLEHMASFIHQTLLQSQ